MKSITGNKCRKCTGGLVSLAKGTTREFDLFRSMINKFKLRSMNQPENNLNPGLLKESGFKQGRYSQLNILLNMPDENRTPVKQAGNGRHRLFANSTTGLSDVEVWVQINFKHCKLKRILEKDAENRDFRCRDINLPGAPECIDTTEFRKQSYWLADCQEKTGDIALNAHIYSFAQFDTVACIYLGKSIQMPCEAVNTRFGMFASTSAGKQNPVENLFRRRKTMQIEWHVKSSHRWGYSADAGYKVNSRFSDN